MINILVVEDDVSFRKLMEALLRCERYNPIPAKNGEEALDVLDNLHIDLLITDIMMPGMDGYTLTEQLRGAGYDLPILMITAKDADQNRRKGFIVGTDDYMVKPVDNEEFILRVKALLRRSKIVSERKITIGKVILNYDTFTVSRELERVTVPKKEFLILYKLLSYPDTIFTRMQLIDEIWGVYTQTNEHTVSVHIGRLRERFSTWSEFSIETVRGLGYRATKHGD